MTAAAAVAAGRSSARSIVDFELGSTIRNKIGGRKDSLIV